MAHPKKDVSFEVASAKAIRALTIGYTLLEITSRMPSRYSVRARRAANIPYNTSRATCAVSEATMARALKLGDNLALVAKRAFRFPLGGAQLRQGDLTGLPGPST
jgi:hypothetical protein